MKDSQKLKWYILAITDAFLDQNLPKPRWKCIVPREEWYQGRKIYGAADNLFREPGDTLL